MTGWLLAHLAVVAATAVAGVAVMLVLRQRRSPQSALAWIAAFLALPYVALPLFVMLGFRGSLRVRQIALPPAEAPAADPGPFGEILIRLGLPAPRPGNDLRLLRDGVASWEALADLVAGARSDIDAQLYLIGNDATGRAFLDLLAARARAGCRVRLLIDGFGGWRTPRPQLRALRRAGGQVRWVKPLLHAPLRGRLNQRNHRKAVIVDGARVWAGGMNVGADYLGPQGGLWDDLSFHLEGPSVADYAAIFAADFDAAPPDRPVPDARGTVAAQVAPLGPDRPGDAVHDALVHAIHRATRRVWLVTPYYVPTETLTQALLTAARRRIDLRILVPRRSNHPVLDVAAAPVLRDLARAGAQVLRAPRMIHAKAGIVDDEGWIGSANLDIRSLLLNRECLLLTRDAATVADLADWFEARAATCAVGSPDPSLPRRLAEAVVRLASPVL